jgi:hypothetical protein
VDGDHDEHCHVLMEFDILDLSRILMDFSNEQSFGDDLARSCSLTTEHEEISSTNE